MLGANAHANLELTLFAEGLNRPTNLLQAPGDTDRFFVTEQHSGSIQIVEDGAVSDTFFNLQPLLQTNTAEQGLLGMAFHPDYQANGRFYVYYTAFPNGNVQLAEYSVSATNPNRADASSRRLLLDVQHPDENHNAGQLAFSPRDGYLYVGIGVLGSPAQDLNDLRGKMLRIDVDGNNAVNGQYGILASNPLVNKLGRDEIWASGLRNPWRFSFDSANGDLYISDVGGNEWEEINYQPAESSAGAPFPGGANYGWETYEGNCIAHQQCATPVDNSEFTFPIIARSHDPPDNAVAVIGGYVYRGDNIPDLQGRYLFSDWVSKEVYSLRVEDGAAIEILDHSEDLDSAAVLRNTTMNSFAVDHEGELYMIGFDAGRVYKIVPSHFFHESDFDDSGTVDGEDYLTYQRGYDRFDGAAAKADGDATADGLVNADDLHVWRQQFGFVSTIAPDSGTIPEPTSAQLMASALLVAYRRRRK